MATVKSIFEQAKTPAGNVKLSLKFNGKVIERGAHIPKAEAKTGPELQLSNGPAGPFVAVGIDLDPPYESFPVLGPILHLLQSDLVKGSDESDTALTHEGIKPIAEWLPPTPPPLSGPHRYVIAVFKQPLGFDATKVGGNGDLGGITKRVRYDVEGFVKEAGLGEVLVATYFTSN